MTICVRRAAPSAALAIILCLGMAGQARADLEIWVSTTGPPTSANLVQSAPSGTSATWNKANFNGFNVGVLTASSNSPGPTTGTVLAGSENVLTNTSTQPKTIWITIGDTGFTAPTAPLTITVTSTVAGTVINGTPANVLTFESYVNQYNVQNATSGFTGSPQSATITTGGPFQSRQPLSIYSLSGGYSITEKFIITLGAGGSIKFSSNTTLSKPAFSYSLWPWLSLRALAIAAVVGALGMIVFALRRWRALGT
jgi:hypothetical protein